MSIENCLTFALRVGKYYRERDHLLIRKSHWGWFPHFSVVFEFDDYLVKIEYVPVIPRRQWFLPIFFEGIVKETYYRKTEILPQEIEVQLRNHLNVKKAQS